MNRFTPLILLSILLSLATTSCTKKEPTSSDPAVLSAEKLRSRGQQVYMSNCTSCHNANAKLDGPVGPAVAGSSLELLKARVLTKGYPAGYKPKRATGVMPALPHLAPEVEALAEYLNNLE